MTAFILFTCAYVGVGIYWVIRPVLRKMGVV